MRRNPNWTPKEDATAIVLKRDGLSNDFIGERLRRTGQAVKRRLTWIKLSAERRAEIGRTKTRNRSSEVRA